MYQFTITMKENEKKSDFLWQHRKVHACEKSLADEKHDDSTLENEMSTSKRFSLCDENALSSSSSLSRKEKENSVVRCFLHVTLKKKKLNIS